MNVLYESYPKFFSLDEEKRSRIINAAMGEFLHGYTVAKTDNIVREAGISKGLLFHYFGTKENLFAFLIDYAVDTVEREFLDRIDTWQRDMLESVWQMSLLKQELSQRFPAIFDFLAAVYLDTRHSPGPAQAAYLARFLQMRAQVLADVYEHCDKTLFRDGIDPRLVINIIDWTLRGYAETMTAKFSAATAGAYARENYDSHLADFRTYLDIFRKSFYKEVSP